MLPLVLPTHSTLTEEQDPATLLREGWREGRRVRKRTTALISHEHHSLQGQGDSEAQCAAKSSMAWSVRLATNGCIRTPAQCPSRKA